VVFGYDGSSAAERALCLMAPLLTPRRALVVTVWEVGVGYTLLTPTIAPAPVDIRAKLEVDEALYEGAQRLAEQGAARAREFGLDAESLAVADVLTPADTLVRIARERDAAMVVVGSHGHSGVRELLVGSTTRAVIRAAPCPVGVVRHDKREGAEAGAAD
jgi:nucleotide-binding universal stress UspA family protein